LLRGSFTNLGERRIRAGNERELLYSLAMRQLYILIGDKRTTVGSFNSIGFALGKA
jgi:hypothetical protein